MTDLIAGQVHLMFTQHADRARARESGEPAPARHRRHETLARDSRYAGDRGTVPGFELVTWYGVFAPARTPAAIVKRLNGEIEKALNDRRRAKSSKRRASSRRS